MSVFLTVLSIIGYIIIGYITGILWYVIIEKEEYFPGEEEKVVAGILWPVIWIVVGIVAFFMLMCYIFKNPTKYLIDKIERVIK